MKYISVYYEKSYKALHNVTQSRGAVLFLDFDIFLEVLFWSYQSSVHQYSVSKISRIWLYIIITYNIF